MRFAVVHFTRGANQSRLLRILRHNKPRIDRNAVPANAWARLQNIDARMAVRQADQFPDVNPLFGANQRQFIRKGDIHITEAIFRQLAHLCGARVGDNAFALKENFVQRAGASRTYWRHTANHAVIFNKFHHHLTRQHTLRTIGNIHVGLLARLLGKGQIRAHPGQPASHLLRCADRRC
ncbi:Uncharacterised protein [Salmonella enterica subsp. enterica serovar Bovismorbificans]|uniref:Uncharacterized protein n=1 Tax=Salmonella enterica subsp. enterica serovar Bovismorbificans TaxID=58097 RepID=A0A655CKZ4_SALET|nr:Uncharacterised protein [Salmonella enterica subsp. enterica serovar Bovismorbificans]